MALISQAQSVSVLSGFATDARNAGFHFIPVRLQWQPTEQPPGLLISYDAGLSQGITGEVYTLSPLLDPHATIPGKVTSNLLTIGLSLVYNLHHFSEKSSLQLNVMPLGYSWQNLIVSYADFDHEQYTMLNPKTSKKRNGFCTGLELRYMSNDKFIGAHVQIPLHSAGTADAMYRNPIPVRLIAGYRFRYKSKL